MAGDYVPTGAVLHVSGAGNDADAGTATRPWRSLARVQAALDAGTLRAGDAVLFERGHRYAGALTLPSVLRGTATAPLLLAAYGSGNAPVIDGLRRVSGWQSLGNGRWRATCTSCTGTPALLRLDGQLRRIARWPNEDEADRGWRYFSASSGRTSITDAAMPAGRNWAGGEVAVRSIAWVIDRLPITAQGSGGRLDFGAAASYDLNPGYGYFIQNHPDAIDREGEWAYDAATRAITIQSATDPNARVIEVPAPGDLLAVRGAQHVQLRDLVLEGAGRRGVDATGCTALVLHRVRVGVVGDTGVALEGCSEVRVQDSIVHDSANNGINSWRCGGCRLLDTTVRDIGMAAGMGANGDGAYVGVSFGGDVGRAAEMRHLAVSRVGYIGIDVTFLATLAGSVVRDFNQVKVDGSGIYTYRRADIQIVDNTVLDAGGSTAGTPWTSTATHGIYLDDNSERMTVARNTVARVGASGIYLHNTRDITLTDNVIVDAAEAGVLMVDDALGTYGGERTTMRGNTLVLAGVPQVDAWSTQSSTFFATLGSIDANRYCDPFAAPLMRAGVAGTAAAATSLAQWRAAYGFDAAASACSERQVPFTVQGMPGANRVANGNFERDLAGWFGWPDGTLDARWESGRLDGGSLRLGFAGPSPELHFDALVGAVAAGQDYLLEFTAQALVGEPALELYLRQAGSPYEALSARVPLVPGTTRGEHALLLPGLRAHADSLLIFEMRRTGTAVALDNVRLRPVTATRRTLGDAVRLETNASASPRSFTLQAPHATVDGQLLPAGTTLTLQPYRSIVLFRR